MNKLLLITILLIIFTGCHENQQWMSKEKSTARKSVLEMTTQSYTAGSSVFTEILPEGSEIGLFITYGNQDSLYKGASLYKNVKSKAVGSSKGSLKWKQTPQVFLRSNRPVMIYAYSPYKVQIPLDPTSIPIKISPIAAETPFYKYGRLSQGQKEVNRKSPLAKLSMNYALSLLSFEIYQDSNINGLFKLTSIQIGNRAGGNTLQYTGTMDIVTGNIKGTPGAHKATLLTIDPSVTLRHAKAEEQNIRIVPTYSPIREKEVEAIFTINGRTYKYIIPEGTCWNKGYKYSYKFYFDGKEIKFHDLVACIWIPKLNKK